MTKSITKPKKSPARSAKTSAVTNKLQPDETKRPGGKLGLILDRLRAKKGASIGDLVKATGWQPHSVRGAISGGLKKKLGLTVASEKVDGRGRVYRIVG